MALLWAFWLARFAARLPHDDGWRKRVDQPADVDAVKLWGDVPLGKEYDVDDKPEVGSATWQVVLKAIRGDLSVEFLTSQQGTESPAMRAMAAGRVLACRLSLADEYDDRRTEVGFWADDDVDFAVQRLEEELD